MSGNCWAGGVAIACLLGALGGCAPEVDAPADHQRAIDHADGDRLAVQLAALPGALAAHVTLHRPVRDVLGTGAPSAASAAVLIVVDDAADRPAVTTSARRLVHAAAPEIADADAALVVELGAPHVELARVGPFVVAAGSRRPLLATLAAGLLAILALAGWIAWRERRR